MCQSRSHGHHHQHHHNQDDLRDASPHGGVVEPSPLTRRQALRQLTTAGLAAAASGPTWAPPVRAVEGGGQAAAAGPAVAKLFDLKQVAPGIFGAISKPTAMLNCNAAVIVNRDHVLVVDTHSKPSAAKALIRQIRDEITELPVRYVVDSHLHGDHAMGNEAYPAVFGANVEMIASVKTREWLEKLGVPRMQETLDYLPKQIAEFRARLEASKDESERAALVAQIEGTEAYLREMRPARVTLPTITFDHRLVIHRGGRDVHLLFLGRAHTAGDVVAYIPSERVIATGDLMHGLLPYMGDGFPDEWPATLRALEALEFDRVIPGHGSIHEGKSVLAQFRGYIEEITEKVARGVERGKSSDELKKTITTDSLASLKANDARPRIERELTALFPRPVRPRDMFEESIASNVGEVFSYFKERKGRRELPLK
jgi:cyclase